MNWQQMGDSESEVQSERSVHIRATYLLDVPRAQRIQLLRQRLTQELSTELNLGAGLHTILGYWVNYFGALSACIYAVEEGNSRLRLIAVAGAEPGLPDPVVKLGSRSALARVAREGQPEFLHETALRLRDGDGDGDGRALRGCMVAPLRVHERLFGVLVIVVSEPPELMDCRELAELSCFVGERIQSVLERSSASSELEPERALTSPFSDQQATRTG